MGTRGPKRKTAEQRRLTGNAGKRARAESAANYPRDVPRCPTWLDGLARDEWERVAPSLEALGLLTIVDQAELACYCLSVADLQANLKLIETEGRTFTTEKGYVGQHPAVSMAAAAMRRIKAFAADFGFSPSSRARIEIPPPPADDDPLEQFLRSRPEATGTDAKKPRDRRGR